MLTAPAAVVLPLVERGGRWVADRSVAPVLVPLLSLGRRVDATEGSGAGVGTFTIAAAGGPPLEATVLTANLFAAAAMKVVEKDLMHMKVAELKEELEARGEAKSGNKAWLRRRLHAAIVRDYLERVVLRRWMTHSVSLECYIGSRSTARRSYKRP